jgi:hypothetical protein
MFKVEYDPDRHLYFIDGRQVPGITAILREAGFIDYDHVNPGILESAREGGTDLHDATEFYDRGILNESKLDGDLKKQMEGYKAFLKKHKVEFEACEVLVGNPTYSYATLIDRHGRVDARRSIVEIKTGAPCYWHGIQLQLQREALARTMGIVIGRVIGLYLQKSGKYHVIDYSKFASMDLSAGLAAAIIYQRKRNVKIA